MLVNRVQKQYACKICGSAVGVKVCKCSKAFYCSKNCQKIDWKTHKSDCYQLVDHPKSSKQNFRSSAIVDNSLHQQQSQLIALSNSESQHEQARRQYDPTPMQYQYQQQIQQPLAETNTTSIQQNTIADEFEENLLNSLMLGVDEGTEDEILKNLNITADELLAACNLDTEINIENTSEDQFFDEGLQDDKRLESEYRETREKLEKELSDFREIQLSESEQQLADGEAPSGNMTMTSQNPKYVKHAKLDDHLLYKTIDDQYGLEEMCSNLIRDMNEYGVCVLDNFIGQDKGSQVLQEVKSMYSAGYFKDGQLVASKDKRSNKNIRGDKIMWVDGREGGVSNIKFLMNQVDAVITMANRMNDNGKLGQYKIRERTKAMVACYEGKGSHYVKHVDNPNRDGRCITCIYYLNVNWEVAQDGGLLRIFPGGWEDRVADIEPIFDRITFFWSDRRNPHEVLPAHRTRYAITLWYFDANEREVAVRKYERDCEHLRKAA